MLNGLWTESCIGMYIVLVMWSEFAIDNLYPELKSVSDAGTEFYLWYKSDAIVLWCCLEWGLLDHGGYL